MSSFSLPSSPEPASDEGNHPNRRQWWEAPEDEPPRRGHRQRCTTPDYDSDSPVEEKHHFVWRPMPDDVKKIKKRSLKKIQERLAILEKEEKKELALRRRRQRRGSGARRP